MTERDPDKDEAPHEAGEDTPEPIVHLFAHPEEGQEEDDESSERSDDRKISLTELEPLDDDDMPLTQKLRQSVVVGAAAMIEALDPVEEQDSELVDKISGERYLPGVVPLAPLTMLAFILNSTALFCAFIFSTRSNPDYLFPFAIAHSILMAHLYFYHIAYRTRRRFRTLRQVLFITIFEAFLSWMLYDLTLDTEPRNLKYVWTALGCNIGMGSIILTHYLALGRGYRRVRS